MQSAKNEMKLNVLRDGTAMVSDEERKRVDTQYDEMRKAWRKRKKMFKDIISAITESGGIKPKELYVKIFCSVSFPLLYINDIAAAYVCRRSWELKMMKLSGRTSTRITHTLYSENSTCMNLSSN